MRSCVFLVLLFCLGLQPLAAFAGGAAESAPMTGMWMMKQPAPTGRWVTANHNAVIQISQCGQDLCGQIVGIVLDPGAPIPKDWKGESQCGLTIIKTTPTTDDSGQKIWEGAILDPRDGSVYHARIKLGPSNHLMLRGYIGLPVFGQTQSWAPYTGPVTQDCRLAEKPSGSG